MTEQSGAPSRRRGEIGKGAGRFGIPKAAPSVSDEEVERQRGVWFRAPVEPSAVAVIDVNDRLRALSTLLAALTGATNDLRLELSRDPCRIRCTPKLFEAAIIEAVSQLRHGLAGPGGIVVRTRALSHDVILMLGAGEYGDAVFRFSSWRSPSPMPPDEMFGTARRLADLCHGRLRRHGSANLILRLPAVLTLGSGKRPAIVGPNLARKEKKREVRSAIAA